MNEARPTILIIIGITGDLSRRYLLPAIEKLAAAGRLSEQFRVVGVTRGDTTAAQVLKNINDPAKFLQQTLSMCRIDLAQPSDYQALQAHIAAIERGFNAAAQHLFYLSIPPQASRPVIEMLGASGLNTNLAKLLLEKPFGTDLASAEELITYIDQFFASDQVYRIDHYLAKEMAQNVVLFREANPLFRHTWNKDFIERIDVMATETIGIEGRASFYEQTGALRDVVQSHALQLAALALMDDGTGGWQEVPARRLAALRHVHMPTDKPVAQIARRGQYEGYTQEVGNANSMVETFVRLQLVSDNPRWRGVPIRLVAGKALHERQTAICLTYRGAPGFAPNQLIVRIQPNGGIELRLWAKAPGYDRKLMQQPLAFAYSADSDLPDAYEQVLLDAIRSDHTLFTNGEEIRESWRILQPVQEAWELTSGDLVRYAKGARPDELPLAG